MVAPVCSRVRRGLMSMSTAQQDGAGKDTHAGLSSIAVAQPPEIFSHVSRIVTMRLNTSRPGPESSGSEAK